MNSLVTETDSISRKIGSPTQPQAKKIEIAIYPQNGLSQHMSNTITTTRSNDNKYYNYMCMFSPCIVPPDKITQEKHCNQKA